MLSTRYDGAMDLARFLQLTGFAFTTFVMIRSYFVSDMLFQFGGLALGVAVFLVGKGMERSAGRE